MRAVLLSCAVLVASLAACSGTATPKTPPQPAAAQPDQRAAAKEPEQIPVGSPVLVRSLAWVVDSGLAYDRLRTFIDANDTQGQRDMMKADRVAQLEEGTRAKLISYRGDLVEIRVQTGKEKGKLWLIEPVNIVDNRTKPDSE